MTETLDCSVSTTLGRLVLEATFVTSYQVTGIFGPSGAGKSSLLECIIGLRRDAQGHVKLGGTSWLDSERRTFVRPELRDIGYVPQAGLLFPHLSARENVAVGRRRAIRRGIDFDRTFATAVDVLEIGSLVDQPIGVLSGGERQRVALARALCSGPRLLVLDEPLASLDVGLQRKLLPYLRRVREEFAVPMLLVSHSPLEIQALCDHVIALREGKIVSTGLPADVLSDARVLRASGDGVRSVFAIERVPVAANDRGAPSEVRTRTRLVGSSVELVVKGRLDAGVTRTLVGIAAEAVMISTEEPRGISAANVLPARIASLRPQGDHVIVHLAIDPAHPPLIAELTAESSERLGLVENRSVFAVVKASSCEVLGATLEREP